MEDRAEELAQRLRKMGHRLTPQRMAILKILKEDRSHPSVEQVHTQIKLDYPMTSLATVYKTLETLKNMGEVLELDLGEGYSRYDGRNPYPHPHIACTQCGKVEDVELGGLQHLLQEAAANSGYGLKEGHFFFYGLCPQCRAD